MQLILTLSRSLRCRNHPLCTRGYPPLSLNRVLRARPGALERRQARYKRGIGERMGEHKGGERWVVESIICCSLEAERNVSIC
jgi:hypothetical protein